MKKFVLFFAVLVSAELFAAMGLKGKFDWSADGVKQLVPAVRYVKLECQSPRIMKIVAVRVDLTDKKLRFQMTPRAKDWGKPMPGFEKRYVIRTERKTCRRFLEEYVAKGENMVLCVNGTPWSPWQDPWNHPYADNQGLLIDNGVLVSPSRNRPGLIIKKDGSADFATLKKNADISHIRHAISGFSTVLAKGVVVDKRDTRYAPRTGYGLSADRKTLYILVVDGRQPLYSMGMSTQELGEFLLYLGASDGLNMDGGGSTTLIIRDEKGVQKLNHYIGGRERTIGGSMGLIYDK